MEEPRSRDSRKPDDRSEHVESDHIQELRARLLEYYDEHRRDLPWREEEDPYRIWVSEVMLQQTRVDTVIPYYRRWMERFPNLDDLAAADQEEVLQLWKGLGYYSRARNLHRAARMVRERHAGDVPDSIRGLKELPGVGEYTAGAVASIAFGRPEPAVDGNVRRVLSRLYDLVDPGNAELRDRAGALVDPGRPGCFNQALMELGATVCTPSSPGCARCPLEDLCLARARGTVEERPAPRRRGPVPTVDFGVGVVLLEGAPGDRRRCLVTRRPEDGLLGGMWEFPTVRSADDEEAEDAARRAAALHGLDASTAAVRPLETLRHRYSHFTGLYRPFLLSLHGPPDRWIGGASEDGEGPEDRATRWIRVGELQEVPLSRAQVRIAEQLAELVT